MGNSYAKWTPGNPCMFDELLYQAYAHVFLACNASSCSSGKVAGLIFYATFSFLWTSQVIGNVSLATLAGGPFGSWYYFGPRDLGEMVR
jgi:Plasma-membrane choline transporter